MVSPEVIAAEKAALGLDKGVAEQYSEWLQKVLAGDWGFSYNSRQPVADIMSRRLPNTVMLTRMV